MQARNRLIVTSVTAGRFLCLALAASVVGCSPGSDSAPSAERSVVEPDADALDSLNRASAALAEGGVAAQGAIASMETLYRRYPRSTRIRNALHNSYLAQQNWSAAAEVFERFGVASLTEDERLHLGRVHVRAGEPRRALELLLPVLQLKPSDPKRAVSAARALYAVGELDQTLRVLEAAWPALERGDDPEALRLRGLSRLRKGDTVGAIADLDELVRRFPEFAPGHYALARACTAGGESERAEVHARRFEELSEATNQQMRRQMYLAGRSFDVRAAREAGRHDEAIEIVREMIELADATIVDDVRMLLAELLEEAGRPEEARLVREQANRRREGSP